MREGKNGKIIYKFSDSLDWEQMNQFLEKQKKKEELEKAEKQEMVNKLRLEEAER